MYKCKSSRPSVKSIISSQCTNVKVIDHQLKASLVLTIKKAMNMFIKMQMIKQNIISCMKSVQKGFLVERISCRIKLI